MYTEEDYKRWLADFAEHPEDFPTSLEWLEFLIQATKQYKKKPDKAYEYFVTFTMKPGVDPLQAYNRINSYASSTQVKAKEFWCVLEHTQLGREHWHCLIRTSVFVKMDFFRTYIKNYGMVKLDKITSSTSERVIKYMTKENPPVNLVA